MELFKEYYEKFKEEPLLIWGTSYDHPIYQGLFKSAIERGYPLTNDEIDKAFKNVEYDLV